MLGAAIENARLVERARRHLAQVQALWEIDRAIVEDRDLAEVFETIAREAARLGGGDAVIVLLDGERGRARRRRARAPRARELLGDPADPGGHAAGRAAWRRAAPTSGPPGRRTTARAPSSCRCTPAAGRWAGWWSCSRAARCGGRGPRHAGHASAAAAAVALAKADARQAEARRASQLALLAGASEIAASTLDVDVLLGAIARYIQRSFGYYSVSVYLVTARTRARRVLAGAAGGRGQR